MLHSAVLVNIDGRTCVEAVQDIVLEYILDYINLV